MGGNAASCARDIFGAYFVLASSPLRLLFFAFVRWTDLAGVAVRSLPFPGD